jgi:hypothetical protein
LEGGWGVPVGVDSSKSVRAITSIISIISIASITSITSIDPPAASFSGRDDFGGGASVLLPQTGPL